MAGFGGREKKRERGIGKRNEAGLEERKVWLGKLQAQIVLTVARCDTLGISPLFSFLALSFPSSAPLLLPNPLSDTALAGDALFRLRLSTSWQKFVA